MKLHALLMQFCALALLGRSAAACNSTSNICPFTGALFGAPVMGKVSVANSAQNGALSQALTQYVARTPSDDLEQQLDLLCPANETGPFFEFWKSEDSDFLTEVNNDDVRAVDAAFKRIARNKGTRETGRTYNKGLTMRIDLDSGLYTNGSGTLRDGAVEEVALSLRKRLVRAELLRFYALLNTAAGAGTAKTWGSAQNPDGDMRAMIEAGRAACGKRADIVAVGSDCWTIRADAYEAYGRNDEMATRANWDPVKLAQYLMVKQVVIDELIYQTASANPKVKGMESNVYSYISSKDLTAMDPSNFKRFYSTTKQGGKWASYVEEKPKYVDVTVEHYSTFISPMTAGVQRRTISA